MLDEFRIWLEKTGRNSVSSRITECRRVERDLKVDLDREYQKDQMKHLISLFEYSRDDMNAGLEPRHGMKIKGDLCNNTATYKNALKLYLEYKKGTKCDSLQICNHTAKTIRRRVDVKELDGHVVCEHAAKKLNIDFAKLIAAIAIWAPKEEHEALNGGPARKCRRAQTSKGEKAKTKDIAGIYLDDNTIPNILMKRALKNHYGISPVNYTTCHIWDKTCYDERYHTCYANLVLIPSDIYALSDFNDHVQKVLQYHAYEIFGWYPEGKEEPKKPDNYPTEWLSLNSEQ